jgi:hypothetical protein
LRISQSRLFPGSQWKELSKTLRQGKNFHFKEKNMTTKATLLKTIRLNCLDCTVGDLKSIEECSSQPTCKLYPYRFGKDPSPSGGRKGNLDALKKGRERLSVAEKKLPESKN